jgi:hypothetical protein
MGKRSDFERIARDDYSTPAKAVVPLLRWLAPASKFVEPCFGAGHLADHLIAAGHILTGAYGWHDDDARTTKYNVESGVLIITNPPYWGRSRDLHRLIENLSNQALTWLPLSADWMHNKSSFELLHHRCRMVVSARRVKWIPDSEFTGKDNAAWYQFGPPRAWTMPLLVGSSEVPPPVEREQFLLEAAE